VVSSWEARSASLIDIETDQVRATLAHPEWVDDAILLNGGRVLTLARDGFIRIWRNPLANEGTRFAALDTGGRSVIARSADNRVFIGGGGPAIAEVDFVRNSVRSVVHLPCVNPNSATSKCWVIGLHATGSGRNLVYAVGDGRTGRLDLSTGRAIWEANIGVPVVGSALHPDGLHFVLLLAQGTVTRIRLEDGRSVDPVGGQVTQLDQVSFGGLAFNHSGDLVAEANHRGLTLRHTADRQVLWRAPVYDRIAVSATWVPPGHVIAAGTAGNTVQLFSASGGPATMILRGHSSWVVALHASPSGRYLASVSSQEMIVWDLIAGEPVKTVSGPVRGGAT
jgi:WD40 repeat protein